MSFPVASHVEDKDVPTEKVHAAVDTARMARWALFLAGALVIALRYPDLFFEPRIWGEEGSIYLQNAYSKPWDQAMFSTAQGYLLLSVTVPTTLAAHLVPMEYVAHFTMGVAFAVQLIPIALIVWGRAPIWRNLLTRAIGIAVVLLNPLGEEIWLTTDCLQFHFALIAFLVFLEQLDDEPPYNPWLFRALIVAAGLSGPPACTLAPLFVLYAWATRRPEAQVRAALLVGITIVQLGVVRGHMGNAVGNDLRFSALDLATVASVGLSKTVIVPFFGVDYATSFGSLFDRLRTSVPDAVRIAGLACAVLLGGALFLAAYGLKRSERAVFLSAFGILTGLSLYLGIGDRHTWVHPVCAARYFYVPGIVLMLSLVAQLDLRRGASWTVRRQWLAAFLILGLTLQIGNWRKRLYPPNGMPHWRNEVAQWRADAAHRLGVWPAGWGFYAPARLGR